MNKNCYRIIFNARRKMRMAVAETSTSHGVGGSTVLPLVQLTSLVLLGGLQTLTATAQVSADSTAPGNQRPTVLSTASGITQINIQTPSSAGVSRNTYSQFDVPSKGVILNNSRTNTSTQTGGYVQANPWLASGSAKVILNEVNSSSASRINGFVEVAGQRAEVIVANPAGIAVNGGGFINASAVTLTTGTAVMNAGSLESFKVRGGTITVEGAGLDTSTADYTNILARAVQVNAGIWASQLKVLTGSNDISASDAAAPAVTATAVGKGTAPSFALDVASLGGMYANKIFIVGTEAGLGVRNSGVVGATAGDVVIRTNGWLSNSGSVYASGNASITTQGSISNTGQGLIAAQGNTNLNAQGPDGQISAAAGTNLAAGMDSAGAMGSTGNLSLVSASTTALNGNVAAGDSSSISATQVSLRGANFQASQASALATAQGIDATGATITVSNTLTAQAQTSLVTDGATVRATQLALAANSISNVGGTLQHSGTADLTIALAGSLDNTAGTISANAQTLTLSASSLNNTSGSIYSACDLTLNAASLSNASTTAQASIYASGNATVEVTGALNNLGTASHSATIAAKGNTTIGAQSVVSNSSSLLAAGMQTDGVLQSSSTSTSSYGNLQVTTSGTLEAVGQTLAAQTLTLSGASLNLSNSQTSGAHIDLTAHSGDILTQSATLITAGTLSVRAQANDLQTWNNSADTSPNSSPSNTNTPTIQAGQLVVSVANLNNQSASIVQTGTAATNITLTAAQGALNNAAGRMGSSGAMNVNGNSIQNNGGQIIATGNVTLKGTSGAASAATLLDNIAGLVQSGATLSFNADLITNTGTYTAPTSTSTALGLVGHDVTLTTNILNNQNGEVLASNNLTVRAAQSIDNRQSGLLYAGNSLTLQDSALLATPTAARSLQVSNTNGVVKAVASSHLQAAGFSNNGELFSQGDLSLDVVGDYNNTGTISANGNTTLTSSGTVTNSGTLSAGDTLSVTAVNLDNTASGELSASSGTSVQLTGTLTNRGLIDSGNNTGTSLTRIEATTVDNLGTGRIYGDNIAIAAGTLNNDLDPVSGTTKAAVIAARNRLDLGVQTLNNNNGATLLSLGDLAIGGALDANNRATGSAGTVTNSASTIQSVSGNVTINTAILQKLNPTFSYAVVNGTTSGQKTEYILNSGQTVQDTELAMVQNLTQVRGGQTEYHGAGQSTPAGSVLLSSNPLGTAANVTAYRSVDVYTPSVTTCTSDRDGNESCTSTATAFQQPSDTSVWSTLGVSVPTAAPPTGERPSSYTICNGCGSDHGTPTYTYIDNSAAEAAWDAAAAPYIELQSKLGTLQSNINASLQVVRSYNQYTATTEQAVMSGGTAGTISGAGNITINASSSVRNDNSRILAGGALSVVDAPLENTSTTVSLATQKSGSAYAWSHFDSGCGNFFGGCNYNYDAYRPSSFAQTSSTTALVSSSYAPTTATPAAAAVSTSAATQAATVKNTPLAGQANSSGATTPTPLASRSAATNAQASAAVTRVAILNLTLPNSSLYRINTSPTAQYFVQTDPAFTSYRTWLSSDYITAQIALDPTVTQKRLGDGFYEQQLIREQVAQLTGRRFLGNYTSDQDQYQALMSSGLTFAQSYNLRPGIALSAAQVALLTSDIVWLEQQTVTLPDGTTTQAFVPLVYAAPREGDLSTSGALLSGNTVSIQTSGDVNNTGTIAGRKLVQIGANTITNTVGTISGGTVALNAVQDINNIGGSIVADTNLSLVAGRNINVASTTTSTSSGSAGGGYSFSQSGIDRVAVVRTRSTGTLFASAGININLTAAQVSSGGDVQMAAGNNLTLSTLTTSRSDNFNASDPNNRFRSASSQEVGSIITSAGNTSLSAGNTLTATAAKVQATGNLSVNANNIVLLAGQSKASSDSVMTNTSGNWISSTTSVTRQEQSSATAQVNQFSGSNVTITAEQDLVSVGSRFAANDSSNGTGTGNLTVEGKNTQTFYAAKDVSQSSKSVESSSSMFGGMVNLGNSSSTDTSAKQVSIASTLESSNAINVKVGNEATFEGAKLTADQIAFTQTDPTKAGVLNLNGSIDTTETSRTEKSETLGVYQSQSGSGSTTQTLNLTQINGAVTFDGNLQVAVQLPQVVTTSGEKANTAAAANATNAASQASVQSQIDELSKQPGLGYLSLLGNKAATANPTQWSQVQLAHDNWSYSQQGLTPAGAALLSIAVAAYAPGLSSGLTGSITSVAGASAATALSAGFATLQAQAAVAMVNNGGDIGKTLEQLGSSESVRNLLVTMATAGALDALNSSVSIDGVKLSNITPQNATLGANLAKNVINNLANATLTSTLTGADLADSLNTALVSAMVSAGAAQTATKIGDVTVNDQLTKAMAHALAGCVAGAAGSGTQGCNSGAVGAVVGELAAQWYDNPPGSKSPTDVLNFAKVMSAAAGAITGDGSAQSVNTAVLTGVNAVENNYLKHVEAVRLSDLEAKKSAGKCDADCNQQIADLKALDAARNQQLADCVGVTSPTCNTARKDVRNAAADYIRNGEILNTRGASYAGEYIETTQLAYATIDGKSTGAWQAVKDMVSTTIEGIGTLYAAKDGDAQAINQVIASSKAVKEFLSDTSNLPYLVGFMTPAQRQVFAAAVEGNDGTTVGKMLTDQTLALVGTISTVGGVAKAATLSATALKDAAATYKAGQAAKAAEDASTAAAKITSNVYADGASSTPVGLQTSAGVIPANPNKTTTVSGRWQTDMGSVITEQMNAMKTEDFGARLGGFNVLNVDDAKAKSSLNFFEQYNKPFLDAAVKRGDDVALATVPKQMKDVIDLETGALQGMFAREIDYLVINNYRPVNVSNAHWETIKGWFK